MKSILSNIVKIFIILFTILSISLFIYLSNIYNNISIDINKLKNTNQIIVTDKDDNFIANLSNEYFSYASFNEIPIDLINAIIAIEDNNFYTHSGVDYKAILRAMVKNVSSLGYSEGASTITQQLVKNTYLSNEKSLDRKIKEIIISFKLESLLNKDQILEYYLNNILFGGRVYGVKEASNYYFSKELNELNYIECAYLAGVVQRPNSFNAFNYPENANERKNLVLKCMYNLGYITEDEYNKGIFSDISEELKKTDLRDNLSLYVDYLDYIIPTIYSYDINSDITIKTSMNKDIQGFISSIMSNENNIFFDDYLKCGIVVIENNTGNILGIGGTREDGLRNLNYAFDTKSQPASTIKPILDFAPAFEYLNYQPQTIIKDEEYYYSDGYLVRNWDYLYKGDISLRKSLAESRNIPSLKLFNEVGFDKAFSFANKLGLYTNEELHESMAIGGFSEGFSVLEMTSAFSSFPNMGVYYKPNSILEVNTENTSYNYTSEGEVVMKESTAFFINDILHNVLEKTSYDLNGIYYCAKTGQSNYDIKTKQLYNLPDNAIRDSWIIGYTKDLTVGVWIGYDVISNTNYLTPIKNNIGKIIVRDILNKYSNSNYLPYNVPSNVKRMGVSIYNGDIYELGSYPNTKYDYFYNGFYPLKKKDDDEQI